MEKRFKLRISSMFRSSLGSCMSKNINDVIEKKPDFLPRNRQHHLLIELFSPKLRPFPSICRPKWPLNSQIEEPSYEVHKNLFPRSKISDREPLLVPDGNERKQCPPASPFLPLNSYYAFQGRERYIKASAKKLRSRNKNCQFNDFPGCNYNGLFSSDDEDEDDDKTTFFSSRSLSSDSSGLSLRRNNACDNRKSAKARRRRAAARKLAKGGPMCLQGRVKGSFAVVKSSSDPYNDFRTSMVEMIVEKQIFAAKDLENMLQCFLSLNSYHHHRVIIEVFTEIWEALFSNCS